MERIDFSDLQVFLTVVRCRSFKLAAIELGITSSAVSHAIRRLESRLNARLLNRTSRSVSVTALGFELSEQLSTGFDMIGSALEALNAPGNGRFGELRINVFADAAHQLIGPALPEFAALYPDVKLTVVVEDRQVDITAEGFDAGVRYGHIVPKDMIAVPLTTSQRWIVAGSPDYLNRYGTPNSPSDLKEHNCIQLLLGNNEKYRWELGSGENVVNMNVPGLITIKDTVTTIEMAKAGIGLAYLMESRIKNELAQGTLIKVLDDYAFPCEPFHIYYSSRRYVHPALRALVNVIRVQNGLMSLPALKDKNMV